MFIKIKDISKEIGVDSKTFYKVLYQRMIELELSFMQPSSEYDKVSIPIKIVEQIKERLEELLYDLKDIEEIEQMRVFVVPQTKKPVIYFLFNDDCLVYIGMTYNIRSRFNEHKQTKVFDSFAIIESTPYNVMLMEACYINKYKPSLNKAVFNMGTIVRMILERVDLREW